MATDIIAQGLALKNAPRETLGAKFRRLARSAEISNPLILDPLLAPAPWGTGTVYAIGTVVAANGGWYVCNIAGTSGATAPSHTNGGTAWDGTPSASVLWSYLGPALIASDDAGAPTLSSSTSTPTNPNDIAFTPVQHPAVFKLLGGNHEAIVTNYTQLWPFESKAATREYGLGSAVGFFTDSLAVDFRLFTNQEGPRIIIDDRYLSPSCLPKSATSTWHRLTYSKRKRRRFIFEGPKGAWVFSSISILRNAQIWPLSAPEIRAAFIGDSLFAGSSYGPWTAGNSVPSRIGKWLGWGDVWNLSKGGTGWIATGGGYYTYGERVAQAVALNPNIIVFGCPTNDSGQTSGAISAAVVAALRAARAAGYTGPIVVLGAWPKNDANVAAIEAAVAAGVTQAADPLGQTFFIPLFATSYAPIILGAWNNSAFNANQVNGGDALSPDGTHPADLGVPILADYAAQEIRRTVLPAIR